MAQQTMDYKLVESEVKSISDTGKKMSNQLNEVWTAVKGMKSSWDSEVFQRMEAEYNNLRKLIDEQTKAIQSRSEALGIAKENFVKTEKEMEKSMGELGKFLKF